MELTLHFREVILSKEYVMCVKNDTLSKVL